MGIDSYIRDPDTGEGAEVDAPSNERAGLISVTRPLKTYSNEVRFFLNPTHGADMNQNIAFGGTPIKVHNGTDNAYWTGSAISGTWDFASTTYAQAGSKSIDASATVNNSTAQIAKGSTQALAGHTAVTGYIYFSAFNDRGTKQILFYGWLTGTSAIVGNAVNLGDYVDTGIIGVWQKFAIDLGDMGLTGATIDAFRVRTIDLGPGGPPDYYLDDIQIEETGSPTDFTLIPALGTWLHVHELSITMADAIASTLADATMPNLAYNKLLAVTKLPIGITYQRKIADEIVFAITLRQLIDFMAVPGAEIVAFGSDGTNTWMTICIRITEPLVLKAEDEDVLTFTINDPLNGLLFMRIAAGCREEVR